MPALLISTLLASASIVAASSISGKQILSARSKTSWFGSSAIGLQGPRDPVFMASTWVFPPTEIIGYRPQVNGTVPAWSDDTTRDLQFQTLYVASPGVAGARGGVDSLAFWNLKPHGVDGTCILLGFNSAAAPDVTLGPPRAGSWHHNLTSDCTNVNLAVPWTRFALSDDGATAVAWTQSGAGDVTIYAFDGPTGAPRWTKTVPCGSPDECQYFLSYGADVSGDGSWIVFDDGVVGSGAHRLNVLSAADGSPRCAPVASPDAVPAHASPDGAFMFSSDDASAPSLGTFSTWRFDAAAGAYAKVGSGAPPLDSAGNGWTLAQYAFSRDAANTTWLGIVWFDSTLLGPSIIALYDAAAPGTVVSWASTTPLAGSQMANGGAVIDCAGALCAAGFWTQKVGGPQPTLVVVAGNAPGKVWNFTTPGSVDAVSVAHAGADDSYFVLAAGCTSLGVCTDPGGDLYSFEVSVSA